MNGKHLALILGALLWAPVTNIGQAQTTDALLDKLVQKGILTRQEADDLRKQADDGLTKALQAKSGAPEWLKSLKFTADFRGRYDGIFQNSDNYGPLPPPAANGYTTEDRHRFRYRLRFGAIATLSDDFELGLRLGSGDFSTSGVGIVAGGSPFSANTTLNNDASRKAIFVDLAYAKWTPTDWAQFEIGKMNNALWFTDMVFDPDYNPEGAQEKVGYKLNDNHKIGFTSGQFVIQERFTATGAGANNDVYLFVNQADWTAKWTPAISSRVAAGLINFLHQSSLSSSLEDLISSFQNGTRADGAGAPDFNPIVGRAELTYTLPSFPAFHGGFPITVGGEYAINPPANSRINEAYNIGVTFGSNKTKGNWQLSYNYKNIETAAVWHGLNDDDFGFNAHGGTDVRGHQVIASYHIYNPLTMNVRYMRTEQISNLADTKAEQDRVFVDLVWAF